MEVARQSTRGSLILFIGSFLSYLLAAVATIIIARWLGPDRYGVFSLSLLSAATLQLLVGLGATVAVTRYTAHYVAINEPERAREFSENAVIFITSTALAFAVLGYVLSVPVAESVLHRPELAQLVQLASLAIVGEGLMQASTAAMIGWNATGRVSVTEIAQGASKLVISPTLLLIGMGVTGALIGHIASLIAGGALGTILLYKGKLRRGSPLPGTFPSDVKEMLRFGLPAFAGSVLNRFSVIFVSIVLAAIASNAIVGNFQVATNLLLPIVLVSGSISSVLLPAFARLQRGKADMIGAFRLSVKYVAYLAVPVIFGVALTARELMDIIFGPSFSVGASYLVILALAYTPHVLGYGVIPAYFNGIGKTITTMYIIGFDAAVLFVGAPILGVYAGLNVSGLILAIFLSNLASVGAGLWFLRKSSQSPVDFSSALSTFIAGFAGFAVAYLVPPPANTYFALIVKLSLLVGVYLTLVPLLKAARVEDLNRISEIIQELPLINRILSVVLRYELWLARKASHSGYPNP